MNENDRNNGHTAEGRDPRGRFAPGNPGRPRGVRHKATILAQELLDGEVEVLVRKCVSMALDGDPAALRLCLERILPPRRDTPVEVSLPRVEDGGAAHVISSIVEAIATGELTPSDGARIAGTVGQYLRAQEVGELEARIANLEGQQSRVAGMGDEQLIATARRIIARQDEGGEG